MNLSIRYASCLLAAALLVLPPLASAATKEVIILDRYTNSAGEIIVNVLFWFPVSAGQQIPAPGFISGYRGATQAENQALQGGTTIEQQAPAAHYASGTTQATIQADLQTRYAAALTAFNSQVNPNQFYGANWDGTTWLPAAAQPAKTNKLNTGAIQVTALGDTTAIAATAGQVISVYGLVVIASAAVNVTIKDGAGTTLFGPFAMVAGVPLVLEPLTEPWMFTSSGNALIFNLSGAVTVSVRGLYTKA